MSIEGLLAGYVLSLLAALSGLAIYYELRRKQFAPEANPDHIFKCEKCSFVYTDDPDVDRSRCPQCGELNEVYNF